MATFLCPHQCEKLCQKDSSILQLEKILYYPGLTPAERKLIDKYPKDAIIVYIQKTLAEFSSIRNFPDQNVNDESDAFRHFIWAGLLTKKLGKQKSKEFLDAHEEDLVQPLNEYNMDIHNNLQGQNEKFFKKNYIFCYFFVGNNIFCECKRIFWS